MQCKILFQSSFFSKDLLITVVVVVVLLILSTILPKWLRYVKVVEDEACEYLPMHARKTKNEAVLGTIGKIVCISLASLFLFLFAFNSIWAYYAINNNLCQTAEGIVEEFNNDSDRWIVEEFKLGDEYFVVDYEFLTLAYKGGVIKEGQQIIVKYYEFADGEKEIYYISEGFENN